MPSQIHEHGTVVSRDLFDYALLRPLVSGRHPENLKIVSGYASPAMVASHVHRVQELSREIGRRLRVHIDLVYGMAGCDGVSRGAHLGFASLVHQDEFVFDGSFRCSYVKRPLSVHSKVYVWCDGDDPVESFIGSANYSEQAFRCHGRVETLSSCDPDSALEFFYQMKERTVDCLCADRDREFQVRGRGVARPVESANISVEDNINSPYFGCQKVRISLLTRNGNLGTHSCLNWGVGETGVPRPGRNPNQSYIRLPSNVKAAGFFPLRKTFFTATTDDGKVLTLVVAQDGDKAIETPLDNSELGLYFRGRMGLSPGSYISLSDARRYGRFDVEFWKISDDEYHMDFSRPGGAV